MADSQMIQNILQGELVLLVDATRSPYDLHTLTEPYKSEFITTLNEAKQWHSAAIFATGDEVGAQGRYNDALAKLRELLRNGYFGIQAVMSDDLPAADRAEALVTYGWAGGNIGDLDSPERVQNLAALAVDPATAAAVHPAAQYSATLVSRINNWLGIVNGNKLIANGGQRATVIEMKDTKRDLLHKKLARVRYLYCFASDLGEGNPELERIGFQRKRAPGEAQGQPLPGEPGLATWDAAARTIAVPELPPHSSYGVAWRQALGGQPEEAGVSSTATVSAAQFSPFVPGAEYDIWFTGRNSRGDGPASNKVRWTAP